MLQDIKKNEELIDFSDLRKVVQGKVLKALTLLDLNIDLMS